MKWFRNLIFKVFKNAIHQIIQESVAKALEEISSEIDNINDEKERMALKSVIVMLRQRVELIAREAL